MRIEIIRHGETALQAEHRYQGTTDAPLSESGRKALKAAGYVPDRLCVTRLGRTRQTAQILFPGVNMVETSGLEEMNFGHFEGRNYTEMEQDAEYRHWVDSGCETRCPGGESRDEFCRRIVVNLEQLIDEALDAGVRSLVLVAHGGTQMAAMEAFCTEKKSYFDWHLSSGEGYLLDTEPWLEKHQLKLLQVTDHNKA